MSPFDGEPVQVGNGGMVALSAPDRAAVDAVYSLAIKLGGTCEGKPGLRLHYHPHYYGAYFRDPVGNKLCVVCHASPASAADRSRTHLNRVEMTAEAQAWIEAWNRRDVEAVLAGFDTVATFRSPLAERATGSAQIARVDVQGPPLRLGHGWACDVAERARPSVICPASSRLMPRVSGSACRWRRIQRS